MRATNQHDEGDNASAMKVMVPAQMMMSAGQGQQHLNYAADGVVDNVPNNGDAAQ